MNGVGPNYFLGSVDPAALWIDTHEVDFGPGSFGRAFQRRQTVARDPFAADPTFLFGFVESVHDAFPLVGPAILDHAMDEHRIDVIGVENFAVMVDDLEDVLGLAGDFRLNEELFSGQPFDGTAQPLKGLIG